MLYKLKIFFNIQINITLWRDYNEMCDYNRVCSNDKILTVKSHDLQL